MINTANKIIIVGGSAGSLPIFMRIVREVVIAPDFAMIFIIHRIKNVQSNMVELFAELNDQVEIIEPNDKDFIQPGIIYLAPQNYHLLIDFEKTFSLDYSEPINYSRPSIDLSFESAASVFGNKCLGILLSGANQDGAEGINQIFKSGGIGIVQDPAESAYSKMPASAITLNPLLYTLNSDQIISFLKTS